jgi:hypothetical protein
MFEQVRRHSLEKGACDYPTCAVGPLDAGGRPSVVLGRFFFEGSGRPGADAVTIWKHLGPAPGAPTPPNRGRPAAKTP